MPATSELLQLCHRTICGISGDNTNINIFIGHAGIWIGMPTSHLRCKKCGVEFDYRWVPLVSVTAVRLGKYRYFRCPACKKGSTFNIWDTRINPDTHHCELTVEYG